MEDVSHVDGQSSQVYAKKNYTSSPWLWQIGMI